MRDRTLASSILLVALPLAACTGDDSGGPPASGVDGGLDATTHCPGCDASVSDAPTADVILPSEGAASEAGDDDASDDAAIGSDAAVCADAGTGRCLIVLADNQGNPQGVSIDGAHVYWVEEGIPGGVHSIPIQGGAIATLAIDQEQSTATAVDGTSIYWANDADGAIWKAPLSGVPDGGAPTPIAGGQSPTSIAVDATQVYWTNFNQGSVARAPIGGAADGGTVTFVATGQTGPLGIAVDATSVYWVNQGGQVMKAPLAGAVNDTTVLATASGAIGIAVDATDVYWTTNVIDGGVFKAPLTGVPDGGAPTLVAANVDDVSSVAVDGTNAYFTTSQNGNAIVGRAPLGGGAVTVLARGQTIPNSVRVDGANLYWANFAFGRVLEMRKAP